MNILETLQQKLSEKTAELTRLDQAYEGKQPGAFLTQKEREALRNRLLALSVRFPKLLVTSLAERLAVTGFRAVGETEPDEALRRLWLANDMQEQSHMAHIDTLTYGRSFVIVWARPNGSPLVTVESPKQMTALYDPATGALTAALKQWQDRTGTWFAVLYEADTITRYEGSAEHALSVVESIPNPLGEPPVVALVNRQRLLDVDGVSEMTDILDLTDALNKTMTDAMVTSERFARPQRYAIGLEIQEDEDGEPVKPFDGNDELWQSEETDTKFGQFEAARLDGYGDLTAVLTQQIGAIAGLPPHYLGLNGDQPPSADAIRSAEASLVAKVIGKQRTYGRMWAHVAELMIRVRDGVPGAQLETLWAAPDTRTPGQEADAALKLAQVEQIRRQTQPETPAQEGAVA